jgi:hypothetical protein
MSSTTDVKTAQAVQVRTTVLPGNRIEISTPDLPPGSAVTVFIVVDEEEMPKRPIFDILADYPGGGLFRSAEEVDAYLREERDSWDR